MSMRDIERAVCDAARVALNNPKLRLKDLQEWTSGTIPPREGEVVVNVHAIGMNWDVAVLAVCDKRAKGA